MIQDSTKDLLPVLEGELDSLKAENAERLCTLLRGLFACMKDLDIRMSLLEERLSINPGGER